MKVKILGLEWDDMDKCWYGTPEVAALVWIEEETNWWGATPPFGMSYEVRVTDRGEVRIRIGTAAFETFDGTVDEAKALCQKGFERRILDSLVKA